MKGEIFNPGQPYKKTDMDNAQDAAQSALRERWIDLFTPGVIADSQAAGEPIPFYITPDTGLTVKVGTGTLIAPASTSYPQSVDNTNLASTGGERAFIPAADISGIPGNAYADAVNAGPGTGTGTGAYAESSNGLGGWTSTPQSTKTRSIPLTNGSLNRVWLRYMATVDTSVTSLHKVTSQILYPKRTDGYEIAVNTSGTAPGGDTRYVLLGTVDLTGSPGTVIQGLISQTMMTYARTRPRRAAFKYSPSTLALTSIPSDGDTVSVDAFLSCKGTGIVSTTNILGLSLSDIGFTIDANLVFHERSHHSAGLIVPDTTSTSSALYPATTTSTVLLGAAGTVFMKQLIGPDETLLVGGQVFTQVLPVVGTGISPMAAADAYVSFSTSDTPGQYGIVCKITGSNITAEKRLSPYSFNSATEYLVCTVQWSGTAFVSPGTPAVQSDNRLFGTISHKDIQAASVHTDTITDAAVTNAKLAANAVGTSNVQDLAITSTKLAALSVGTSNIQASAVGTTQMADSAITSQKLAAADNSSGQNTATGSGVKTGHIQNAAIVSASVATWDNSSGPNTTTSGSGIATDHIKNGAVTAAKMDASIGVSTITKYTKTYSDFSSAALTNSIALFTLPAKSVIESITIKHSAAFTGTGITAYTVEVGISGVTSKYASAFDVHQTVASNVFSTSLQFSPEDFTSSTNVVVTAKSTGANLNLGTTGSVDIWVKTVPLP